MRATPLFTLSLAALIALPAAADPLDTREARRQLYRADRAEVVQLDLPGLDAQQIQTLSNLAQTQRYFAALAFAPAAGILAEPTVLASNYHSIEAARAAALGQCDQRRAGQGAACVLGLEVRPAGFEDRTLTLSAEATEAFERRFRHTERPRAFAISPVSGAWGYSENATSPADAATQAVNRCAASKGDADCIVVVAD